MNLRAVVLSLVLTLALAGVAHGSNSVVSTEWLAANLNNPNVRVIEVSVIPGVYERGHIPGAVNFAWHTDLVDPVIRDIASPEKFEELVQSAGINNDTTVVTPVLSTL